MRLAAALVLAVVAAAAAAEAGVRRAAVDAGRLAAEVDGVLYLEVFVEEGDTAASLAARYAGAGAPAAPLRAANDGAEPSPGAFYRIPFESLLNEPRRQILAALYPEEVTAGELEFGSDGDGRFAVYRLKPGEALYSAVVVRFCGRLDPGEVNALAETIARRSGIADVRRIPAGHPIRIPLDLLMPEHLPPGSPERNDFERAVAASARWRLSSGATRLGGVHVILDAGHGGDDPGAVRGGVHEHENAYDVMCRVRDLLLKNTRAQVVTTIRDRSSGYRPLEGRIPSDGDEYLLTDPPYDLRQPGAATTGVNARWRIANAEMERLVAQGVPTDRIVFVSFHADSLHPDLRGTMIYVPGRGHRRGLPKGVTPRDVERAEGLSRALARKVTAALREEGLLVHRYLPIRDHVIRNGRAWIPAVLRASRVPHSLLVEIANLGSPKDRADLVDSAFRGRFAEAFVAGLVEYYGGPAAGGNAAAGKGAPEGGPARLDPPVRPVK